MCNRSDSHGVRDETQALIQSSAPSHHSPTEDAFAKKQGQKDKTIIEYVSIHEIILTVSALRRLQKCFSDKLQHHIAKPWCCYATARGVFRILPKQTQLMMYHQVCTDPVHCHVTYLCLHLVVKMCNSPLKKYMKNKPETVPPLTSLF